MPSLTGKVVPVDLNQEMKSSYLEYAMSVIVGRALPDVRDGLKPVHRRILYVMHQQNLNPDKPFRKSAYIVGQVMARFHPHGDSAIYDALVRLAQDFSIRYMLVEGHGNFGSVDGDSAAAMRYTEARMARITLELLADIEKNTVEFMPNYDNTVQEPVVLPSRIPNLLVNGSSGIAVGMATNIPPHNLGEVIDGVDYLISHPEASSEDLMQFIKGPDFPTAGVIMGREGIVSAYQTGRGTIKVRALSSIEKTSGGKNAIIVTELPYQVNKARLIEKIAELVKDKKIEGISGLRDESDRRGMRIVIELKRDAKPQIVLNYLYKHTQMQDSFGVIMLALVDGRPQVLSLREILYHYLQHQKEVITRRTRFDLDKAEKRAHILEGLLKALDQIDAVIQTIRSSQTVDIAKAALMARFELSEIQASSILEMRLQRLTGLERAKLEKEYAELEEKINYLRSLLADEQKILGVIRDELKEIKRRFADPRRTKITEGSSEMAEEDLIPEEDMVITITNQGYIKRISQNTYRSQKRGGRGIAGMDTKSEDFISNIFVANTHHFFLFFTDKGKVYRLKVHEIPEAGRTARGTPIINLLCIEQDEKVTAVIPVWNFEPGQYLLMATQQGIIKKTELSLFENIRSTGLIAIKLKDDDQLVQVKLTDGQQEVFLATRQGYAIRFAESQIRSMARSTSGLKGIDLRAGDQVVAMDVVNPQAAVLTVSSRGYGKRSALTEYRSQSRGGKGMINFKNNAKTGEVVSVMFIRPEDEVMLISAEGIIIRLKAGDISLIGRSTQGTSIMKLDKGDFLVALTKAQN